MIKVVHIHTDLKFISGTHDFEGGIFENSIILISNNCDARTSMSENPKEWLLYDYSTKSVNEIIRLCSCVDLVVLYDLNFIKCVIAMKLPLNIKVAWRFFGYELYGREYELYLSQLSLEANKMSFYQKAKDKLSDIVVSIVGLINWGYQERQLFDSALNRIDYFLGFSKAEYDYLYKRWNGLPCFIQLPLNPPSVLDPAILKKRSQVIISNNKTVYNNSLDIIKIVESAKIEEKIQFVLLFNYGPETNYSREVLKAVKDRKHFTVILDYLSSDEFTYLYQGTSAAVFNVYRQMALGNIFICLVSGVKLYLNKTNIIMHWLISRGFIVSSIDKLSEDLGKDDIELSAEEKRHNYDKYQELALRYSKEDFQKTFYEMMK